MPYVPNTGRAVNAYPSDLAQLHSALARLIGTGVTDGDDIADLIDFEELLNRFSDRQSVADVTMPAYSVVYVSSEGHVALADASALATGAAAGMTLHEVATGGFVSWRAFGVVEQIGWGLTPNSRYFLSTNAGEILTAPVDASGNIAIIVGDALSVNELFVNPRELLVL